MPDKGKKSTSASGSKGHTPSSSQPGISTSGRSMPPTTRSMQGRLSGTSQASSPQVQAGPSRGAVQQGASQRTMTAGATRGSHAESSDEEDDDDDDDDDDNDDDDDGSEDGSDDSDDDDGNETREYSDDDDDDVLSKVIKMFATAEPNGLTKSEMFNPAVIGNQANSAPSLKYRELVKVVAQQAIDYPAFYNKLSRNMTVPGNEWSLQMCSQLRTRFQNTILRFDANGPVGHYTVINTAKQLSDLIRALKSLTKPTNWQEMVLGTRLHYFGLVLEVLQGVVARDNDSRSARSSPYAVETANDHNLYLQMVSTGKCAHAAWLLHGLFNRLQTPMAPNQAENIRSMLKKVERKHGRYGSTLKNSGDFVLRLQHLAAAVPIPRSS